VHELEVPAAVGDRLRGLRRLVEQSLELAQLLAEGGRRRPPPRPRRDRTRAEGVAHTHRVESPQARWLCVTCRGGFERFVRELSRPAESDGLPPLVPPTPAEMEQLTRIAKKHGIELVGPSL
jgi:hypothetical protein